MHEKMAKRYMLILSHFFSRSLLLSIIRVLEVCLGGVPILRTFVSCYILTTSQNP